MEGEGWGVDPIMMMGCTLEAFLFHTYARELKMKNIFQPFNVNKSFCNFCTCVLFCCEIMSICSLLTQRYDLHSYKYYVIVHLLHVFIS